MLKGPRVNADHTCTCTCICTCTLSLCVYISESLEVGDRVSTHMHKGYSGLVCHGHRSIKATHLTMPDNSLPLRSHFC